MRTIHRDIVGGFIFSADNKILLGKSIHGGVYADYWIIPGGGIEAGESKLDALKREIKEETGIDISTANIVEIKGSFDGESEKVLRDTGEKVRVKMNFYDYKVQLTEISAKISLAHDDDFIDAQWFGLDEVKGMNLSQPTTIALQKMDLL